MVSELLVANRPKGRHEETNRKFVNLPRREKNITCNKDIQTENTYLEIYRRFNKNINF
jgi:hypothetical protein